MQHTAIHPPRVYSYTRFSTPEQAQGDSTRRQTEAAAKWAARRGLVLDDALNLFDRGVSAYRGTNTDEDKGLGAFLFACRSGLIPDGSYLLVESLDRISRMTPRKAQRLIDDIVDAGVTICTLNDGQEYDAARLDSDPTALLIGIMVAWRAHEESRTKGRRVAEAWAEKRRKVRSGEHVKLTTRAPAWLQWTTDGWTFRAPHHDTVRRVFQLTLDGMGEHKIAALFNSEGVPLMGRSTMWHRSTISKILRNDSTIGVLTPAMISYSTGKRQRLFEAPIEGAYPAVISQADWLAVQAIKKGGANARRGRGSSAPLTNLFAGLARCPECGAAMTRVHKSNGAKPRLVCTRAKAGAAAHGYRSIHQEVVEAAFLSGWQGLLVDVPAGSQGNTLDTESDDLQGVIWETEDRLEKQLTVFDRAPSSSVASHIRSLELQLDSLRSDLKAIKERREITDGGLIHARIDMLAAALGHGSEESEPVHVAKVNAVLKVLFSGIIIDYLSGKIRFQWRQGGEGSVMFSWPTCP